MQNPLTDFDKAIRVAGLRQIQKLHWDKGECFLVTFKICFMQTPQIVNFLLVAFDDCCGAQTQLLGDLKI